MVHNFMEIHEVYVQIFHKLKEKFELLVALEEKLWSLKVYYAGFSFKKMASLSAEILLFSCILKKKKDFLIIFQYSGHFTNTNCQ